MASPRCDKCIKARPGQRVVRGPNWWGGDEDGGSHYVGTVVSVCQPGTGSGYTTHPVEVQWDAGPRGYYRAGCTNATCDLRLIDAGPTGVIFSNVTCGSCETKGVAGTLWKCANCADYNLCHSCYMADKHNIEHEFLRYDDPGSQGFRVSSRKKSEKFQFFGIFPGAEVQSRNKDKTGIVGNVRGEARLLRKTDAGRLCYNDTDKVDDSLKFNKAASGGYYYRNHMPTIALPGHDPNDIHLFRKNWKTMARYDNVRMVKEPEQLRRLYKCRSQNGYEPNAEWWGRREGHVENIDSAGNLRVSVEGNFWWFNPECLIGYPKASSSTKSRGFSSGSKALGYGLPKMKALHAACHLGQEDVVKVLVMAAADLEEADGNGDRAVHYSAGCEQSRVLEVLLNSGVDIGACNMFGETALHVAIKENSVDCARLLAKNIKDSQINIQDNTGDTVLHSSINAGMQQEIISLLFQVPTVNVAIKNDKGETPLHIAASKANVWATQQILQKNRGIVEVKTKTNVTALYIAASNNLYEIARTLLTQGYTTVDAVRGQALKTALSTALERGYCKIVEVLIEAGLDVNIEDANGNAPLHICLMNNHCEIAKLLVEAGADVNKQDANGNAPLHICVMNHHCEIVELLVEAGADVNKQDANGNTPLHISLMSRRTLKASEISSATAPKLKAIATELEDMTHGDIDTSLALACFFVSTGSSLKPKNKEGLNVLNFVCTTPVLRTLLKWAPKTRASRAEEASVERRAEESTAVEESAANSAPSTSGPVMSDEQKHCSSEKEEPKQEEIDDRHICAICMERERTVAFLCGHGTCQECSTKIPQCHVCRAPVQKIIKLYEG